VADCKKRGCNLPPIILVVEDDADVRRSLLRLLRTHGHNAVGAKDGSEALRQALVHPPAVIVLDLLLPAQNGVELARALRAHPSLHDVPVIALSASPSIAAESASVFQQVLAKPCPAKVLLTAIAAAVPEQR
jgi:CheY-like chemotaxis protein